MRKYAALLVGLCAAFLLGQVLNRPARENTPEGAVITIPISAGAKTHCSIVDEPPQLVVEISGAQDAGLFDAKSLRGAMFRDIHVAVGTTGTSSRITFELYRPVGIHSANVELTPEGFYQLRIHIDGLDSIDAKSAPRPAISEVVIGGRSDVDSSVVSEVSAVSGKTVSEEFSKITESVQRVPTIDRTPTDAARGVESSAVTTDTSPTDVAPELESRASGPERIETDSPGPTGIEASAGNVSTRETSQPVRSPSAEAADSDSRLTDSGAAEVILPVIVHGEVRGDVYAVLQSKEGGGSLETAGLMSALTPALEPSVFSRLERELDGRELVTLDELGELGIHAVYDPEGISTRITIEPKLRRGQVHNLHSRQQQEPTAANVREPANFSGALDMFLADSWAGSARQSATLELDGHLNYRGLVLLNRHGFEEGRDQAWRRRETQLIKDFPEHRLRFSVGDVSYPFTGLASNRRLSGFSASTSFGLQPYRVSFPVSREEFFLEHDSRVDLYVDGQLRSTSNLTAGPHSVFDLPLVDGVNEIKVEITDIFGRRQILRFFEAQDQRLLEPGLLEFGVTVGAPRDETVDGIEYETENPAVTAFLRRGVSERLTAGAHLERDNNVGMLGLTSMYASLLGTVDVDLAVSKDQRTESAAAPAALVNYIYRKRRWSVSGNFTWQANDFATLKQPALDDNLRHAVRLGIILPALRDWTSSVSLAESERWGGLSQSSQRLSLSRKLFDDWRVRVDLTHRADDGGEDGTEIALQLQWTPRRQRYQSNLGLSSENRESNVQAVYRKEGELGMEARTTASRSDLQQRQHLDLKYVAPLFESGAGATFTDHPGRPAEEVKTLSIGTALAFAGRSWSQSRPIKGQPFAIITGRSSLGDGQVGITRGTGNNPTSYLDGASDSAVLPNLSPYYVNEIGLDASELPMGAQMSDQLVRIKPAFRSGTRVQVGVEGTVYLVGQLIDSFQKSLVYEVGWVSSVNNPEMQPIQLFTDERGHFEVSDLQAGDYILRIRGLDDKEARIHIPEGSFGRLELGSLSLKTLRYAR